MKSKFIKKNQRGQATVEAILIIVILLAVSISISNAFSQNNFFASLIEGPWDYVDGMIRDGVWKKSSVSHTLNPNARVRHDTVRATLHNAAADTGYNIEMSSLKGH